MSFSTLLSQKDRDRLRRVVRAVHLRHLPDEHLTDYECDKLIDSFSADVIETQLKAATDLGVDKL